MVGVPRSQVLIAWRSAAGALSSGGWISPANTVTLVKSVYYSNQSATPQRITLWIGIFGQWNMRSEVLELQPGTTTNAEVWIVLHPSHLMYAQAEEIDQYVWISGAVLQGAPLYEPVMGRLPRVDPHD